MIWLYNRITVWSNPEHVHFLTLLCILEIKMMNRSVYFRKQQSYRRITRIKVRVRRRMETVDWSDESLKTIGWFSVSNVPVTISENGYRMNEYQLEILVILSPNDMRQYWWWCLLAAGKLFLKELESLQYCFSYQRSRD